MLPRCSLDAMARRHRAGSRGGLPAARASMTIARKVKAAVEAEHGGATDARQNLCRKTKPLRRQENIFNCGTGSFDTIELPLAKGSRSSR